MSARGGGRRGFSALEVMGAVLLVGLALVPALNLLPSGARRTGLTQSHVQARALADGAIDEWIVSALAVGRPSPEPERTWQVPSPAGEPFVLTRSASEVDGKPGLWLVAAKVEWDFPAGKRHELECHKLFCEPELSLRSERLLAGGAGGERRVAS